MCILLAYTLIIVVTYYDISVHVGDGFQKKVWMGWVSGVSTVNSIQFYFGFLEFF